MFPRGLHLRTAEEFGRFNLLLHRMTKEVRYARCLFDGGHVDSLDDISVYAQLAQNFDSVSREGDQRPVDAPQGESSPAEGRASPLAKEPAAVQQEETMNHPTIEYTPNGVTVEGVLVGRPSRISAKQWIEFWEDIKTFSSHGLTYQDGWDKGYEEGLKEGRDDDA
jgi:hypothetical protein